MGPEHLAVITGTGTGVGKTWVAARLVAELRAAGVRAVARKPVQSFDPGDSHTDAHVLARASGEEHTIVCPLHRWYETAMAPPMAAEALGRAPFVIDELVAEIAWPVPAPQLGLVESAGGVRSPLARDGDTTTLIEALQPDVVVLVADAGLGTINGVRLSVEALDRAAHVADIVVFLNRFDGADDLHRRNRTWLVERDHLAVTSTLAELSARIRSLAPRRS